MQPSDGWQELIQFEKNINVKIAKIIFQSNVNLRVGRTKGRHAQGI